MLASSAAVAPSHRNPSGGRARRRSASARRPPRALARDPAISATARDRPHPASYDAATGPDRRARIQAGLAAGAARGGRTRRRGTGVPHGRRGGGGPGAQGRGEDRREADGGRPGGDRQAGRIRSHGVPDDATRKGPCRHHLPRNLCVNAAMRLTSTASPVTASAAARTVSGSSRRMPPGKKPRP
jgi:hypothetical protein